MPVPRLDGFGRMTSEITLVSSNGITIHPEKALHAVASALVIRYPRQPRLETSGQALPQASTLYRALQGLTQNRAQFFFRGSTL